MNHRLAALQTNSILAQARSTFQIAKCWCLVSYPRILWYRIDSSVAICKCMVFFWLKSTKLWLHTFWFQLSGAAPRSGSLIKAIESLRILLWHAIVLFQPKVVAILNRSHPTCKCLAALTIIQSWQTCYHCYRKLSRRSCYSLAGNSVAGRATIRFE